MPPVSSASLSRPINTMDSPAAPRPLIITTPISLTDDSTVTFAYDSLSRVLAEVQNGETIASVYDGVGRRLSCTYPDGRVIEQGHDAIDRVKTIADQGAAANIAEYDYLGPARVLERRFINGTRLTHHDDAG